VKEAVRADDIGVSTLLARRQLTHDLLQSTSVWHRASCSNKAPELFATTRS
jgi:hypothetical protein